MLTVTTPTNLDFPALIIHFPDILFHYIHDKNTREDNSDYLILSILTKRQKAFVWSCIEVQDLESDIYFHWS